ncbi:MAG: HD domain-containing phosphohydrolase [Fibrobacterota bacterium]
MLQTPIEDVKGGMVLGKSIYNAGGDLLLAAGFRLHEKYIHRLKILGYSALWIQEEGTENVIPESIINEQMALQTNKAMRESVEVIQGALKVRGQTKAEIDHALKDTDRFKTIIMAEKVKALIDDIVDGLVGQQDVLININSIRGKDDYLYQHNLDVTVTSVLLANRLKLNKFDIAEMALGAILHDLGMVVIPDEIQKKGKRLSFQEFTILKEHTTYGYTILKENPRISPVSAHIAYQHHERQDGGGFPRGLKGENELPSQKRLSQPQGTMHRYAEIVAVANAYDNLIAPRNAADAKSPDEALRIIIRSAGTQLNKHVVDALITITPAFPVGAFISIVDGPKELLGFKGVVARNNSASLDRPETIIFYNKSNRRINPIAIDLEKYPGVKIQFILRN